MQIFLYAQDESKFEFRTLIALQSNYYPWNLRKIYKNISVIKFLYSIFNLSLLMKFPHTHKNVDPPWYERRRAKSEVTSRGKELERDIIGVPRILQWSEFTRDTSRNFPKGHRAESLWDGSPEVGSRGETPVCDLGDEVPKTWNKMWNLCKILNVFVLKSQVRLNKQEQSLGSSFVRTHNIKK